MGESDRAIAALQKLLSIPYAGALARVRSLLRFSGSIRCSIRFGMIRASKNSSPRRTEIGGQIRRRGGQQSRRRAEAGNCFLRSIACTVMIVS